jgi:hypothetical protein
MDKQHKIFGITPAEPLQILRILITQLPVEDKVDVNLSLIRVLQMQATSLIIETRSGPEVTTRVDYLTPSGIFDNDALSGVGIAEEDDDISVIELNFILTRGEETASLIIPANKYSESQALNRRYLQKIIEHFAPDRYSLEVKRNEIVDFLLDVFGDMTGKKHRLETKGGN